MKKTIKKILSKNPKVYQAAKSVLSEIRNSMSRDRDGIKEEERRLKCMKNAAELIQKINLRAIRFNGEFVSLQLEDNTEFYFDSDMRYPLLSIPAQGFFEKTETQFLDSLVREGQVVFDVGANFGWYAVHLSKKVGKEGRVYSFEPIPSAFFELERNIGLNSCSDNTTLVNKALGQKSGKTTFFVPEDLGTAFSSQYNYYGNKVEVDMTTLDDFISENKIQKIDLIKADVEGGELNVLRGAERTIEKHSPDLFLEIFGYHTDRFGYAPQDIFDFLGNKGYQAFYLKEDGTLLSLKEFNPELPGYNFYFTTKR